MFYVMTFSISLQTTMGSIINSKELSFSGQPFRLRRKTESLELALFVMVAMCFDHSKSLLRVTPKYLASMTSSSTCPVSE